MQASAMDLQPCEWDEPLPDGVTATCGTLEVPENRSQSNTGKIDLPVIHLSSGSTQTPPVVFLNGGPGGTNLRFGLDTPDLLSHYDVLLVGYRGVDDGLPLICPEVSAVMIQDAPLSLTGRERMGQAASECAGRLMREGVDLSSYTMFDVIQDLELARRSLGHEQIHLFARSYGTRIAQYYARMYPEVVASSVLVTVNPPGHFKWFPEATDAVIGQYADLCAADEYCKGRTSDLAETLYWTLNQADRTWLGLEIDADKVWAAAFLLMSSRETSVLLFDALIAAEKGDNSGLFLLDLAFDLTMPHAFVMGDMLSKAGSECQNDANFVEVRMRSSTSMGSPLDLLLQGACSTWPIVPFPEEFNMPTRDATPTLLVNGDLDVSTPLRYVEDELLPHLENGELFVLRGFGHDDWVDNQVTALDQMLTSFFKTGVADTSGYIPGRVDFRVEWPLPLIAKLSVATVLVVLFAVVALLFRTIRRRVSG